MSTVEKLFVQIFERKKRILDQVKHQTDLFDHHLASKCLLAGIAPPDWLWSPSFPSFFSDPKDLKKEDLISGLLLPRPQPVNPYSTSHYSICQNPIITTCNKEALPNASCTEVHASNNATDAGDRLSILPPFPTGDTRRTSGVLELDSSVTSPQECRNAKRLSENCPDHAQSLVKMQRSKSRQKALELRNSAKTARSHLCDKNNAGVCSSQGRGSVINSLQYDHVDELELVRPADANTQDFEEEKAKVGDSEGNVKNSDIDHRRTIRSGSSSQRTNSAFHGNVAKEYGLTKSVNDLIQQPNHVNQLSEMVNPFVLANASCMAEELNVHNCRASESNRNVFSFRITRSKSSISQANTSKEPMEVGNSACVADENDGQSVDKSANHCNSVGELSQLVMPLSAMSNKSHGSRKAKIRSSGIKETGSNIFVGRITRSKSSSRHPNCVTKCLEQDNTCGNGKDGVSEPKQLTDHVDNLRESIMKAIVRDCHDIDAKTEASCQRIQGSSYAEKFNVNEFVKVDISSANIKDGDDILAFSSGKSSQLPQKSSFVEGEGVKRQVPSGTQPNVLPCTESVIAETDKICDGLAEAFSVILESRVEVLESRPLSECVMLVKPKQLDFDDVEESSWHETSDPELDNSQPGTSEKQFSSLLHSRDILDNTMSTVYQEKHNPSIEMLLLKKQEFSTREENPGKHSSESLTKDDTFFVDERMINSLQKKMDSFNPQNRNADSYLMGSWPQHKRIKIRGQLISACSPSPSLKIKPYQLVHTYNMEGAVQSDIGKSVMEDMHQSAETLNLEESEVSLSKLQIEEVAVSLEGWDRSANNACTSTLEQEVAPSVSSLKKLADGVSQGCVLEKAKVATYDLTTQPTAEENQFLFQSEYKLKLGVSEVLTYTEDSMLERNYHLEEKDSLSHCFSCSPHSQPVVGPDQNMPEFEGFVMETDDGQPCTSNKGIDSDKFELPPTALGRASVPEHLCKTSNLHAHLSYFSATCNLQKALNLYQSIPNGLLEGIELRNTHNINSDRRDQLGDCYNCLNEEVNRALHGRALSVSLPLSNTQSVWDIRKPCMSSVRKLWDGIPLKSGSSEKRVSSISELPCINEETENTDGVADTYLEGHGPEVMISSFKREPLADITKNSNPLTSVCEADRHSRASMNTEFSFSGTCDHNKSKLGNQNNNKRRFSHKDKENPNNSKRRFTGKDKENQNLSVGGDCVKRVNELLHSRISKPKLPGKSGLRKGGLRLSEKESKRNNIVSNITSFIPLVQQKQAAAVITGKRDIKVKALEAAEAAKHLAEKKENERKMRKEALKLERVRMEEENLRRLELEKKNKEEKQKTKDLAAKKRQREEEERKEKERKRKRVEELRRHQPEHDKKFPADKEEKEVKFWAPDERAYERKESRDALGRSDKIEKAKEDNLQTVPDTEPRAAKVSTIDTINASIIPEDTKALSDCGNNSKVMGNLCKTTESDSIISSVSREQSYEISPYKGSDDEDEEEDDDIQNNKFAPSWASKSHLALAVSSQHGIDPESIFLPESFCSISEVLLPRKLQ